MGLMNKLRQRLHRLQAKEIDIVKSSPATSNEVRPSPALHTARETSQYPVPSKTNVSGEDACLQDIVDAFHHPDVLDVKRRIRIFTIAARFIGAQLVAHPLNNPSSPSPSSASSDTFKSLLIDAHGTPLSGASTVTLVNERVLKIHDFAILGVLGVGTYGKVLRVREQMSGQMYALKVIGKAALTARAEETIMVELEALKRVSGMPGFLRLEGELLYSNGHYLRGQP